VIAASSFGQLSARCADFCAKQWRSSPGSPRCSLPGTSRMYRAALGGLLPAHMSSRGSPRHHRGAGPVTRRRRWGASEPLRAAIIFSGMDRFLGLVSAFCAEWSCSAYLSSWVSCCASKGAVVDPVAAGALRRNRGERIARVGRRAAREARAARPQRTESSLKVPTACAGS